MMKKIFTLGLSAVVAWLGSGCTGASSTAHIPAVEDFDAERYMGVWYEIARLPHSFEKGLSHVTAAYSLNKDGTVKVVNTGLRKGKKSSVTGKAWFAGAKNRGELKVSFFFPFSGAYRIIRLDRDYSVAVVTGSSRSYLWILARKPRLSAGELRKLVSWARSLGFDTEQLIYPEQKTI